MYDVVCYDCLFVAENELRWDEWCFYRCSEFVKALVSEHNLSDLVYDVLDEVDTSVMFELFNAHANYDEDNVCDVARRCTRSEIANLIRASRKG